MAIARRRWSTCCSLVRAPLTCSTMSWNWTLCFLKESLRALTSDSCPCKNISEPVRWDYWLTEGVVEQRNVVPKLYLYSAYCTLSRLPLPAVNWRRFQCKFIISFLHRHQWICSDSSVSLLDFCNSQWHETSIFCAVGRILPQNAALPHLDNLLGKSLLSAIRSALGSDLWLEGWAPLRSVLLRRVGASGRGNQIVNRWGSVGCL